MTIAASPTDAVRNIVEQVIVMGQKVLGIQATLLGSFGKFHRYGKEQLNPTTRSSRPIIGMRGPASNQVAPVLDDSTGGARLLKVGQVRPEQLLYGQLFTLLETRWVRPRLLDVKSARLGLVAVDVVKAEFGGKRFDVCIDRRQRLPRRIVEHRMSLPLTGVAMVVAAGAGMDIGPKPYEVTWELEDYKAVDGILMPHTVKQRGRFGFVERVTYELNPEYDPRIFQEPPSADFGPRDWRKVPQ